MPIKARPAPAGAKPAVTRGVAPQAPKNVQAKETVANAVTPKGEVTKTVEVREFDEKPCNLGITRSFTVKRDDDFVKVGLSINMPCTHAELTSGDAAKAIQDLLKEFIEAEAEAAMAQYGGMTGRGGEDDGEGEEEEADEPVEEEEADEEQLDADAVMALPDRKAVLKAIEEYGIEGIDPDEFPKTKAGTVSLKEAIVAAYFPEEEEGEEATDEEAEEGESEEAELTEEDVRAMKRPDLIQLIKDNELEIDPSKYPKIAALQDAVIERMAAAAEADEEETGDADEEAEGDGEEAGYSEADLKAMEVDDLKEIYKAWSLGKFPAGPPAVAKKTAIKAILEAQGG
jgi:hypothetical protein